MKPGIKTSEFWTAWGAKLLAAALGAGFVSAADVSSWEQAVSRGGVVLASILAILQIASRYVQGRIDQKLKEEVPTVKTEPKPVKQILPHLLILCALFGLAQPAEAQLLPWRQQRNQQHQAALQRIAALEAQIRAQPIAQPITPPAMPSVPQPIVVPVPQPILIQQPAPSPYHFTPPNQILDPGGSPKQILDPSGKPKQILDPGGSPKQILDPKGAPKQILDPGGAPKQDLMPKVDVGPPSPSPAPPATPGPPTGMHSYSRVCYALYRPSEPPRYTLVSGR